MELTWPDYLLALLIVLALVQCVYYFFYFSKLAFYKDKRSVQPLEPVSVIIVAKNELQNLDKNLPAFFEQNHPEYEIIVVNNASWDGTDEYLKNIGPLYPRMKVVTIVEQERYPKGKKFAITLAIKAAKYDTLLFSDADCQPASPNWISEMQQSYRDKTEVVIGYSPYRKRKGLLNYLIRYETFYTAMQYLSFALAGKAYMGVGRNLSYKKSTFFRVKGFASHNHIVSGDDDLFVNEVATKNNVAICIAKDSFVVSEPKRTWGDWMKQKKRHLHTGKYYRGSHKTMLALLNISHILFLVMTAVMLILWHRPEITAIAYGVRLITMFIVSYNAMAKLREKNLVWALPLLDIFYAKYYAIMGIRALFSKQKQWVW